ncbi:iron-sulfur cluster biosynthesis family protein [Virgibacillus xinjiangensis]|uniref:Iron-sulfur cluster biosynthesis family protein n=1 Tax=Virgibacillus xinjiangensis TaxID=393090 RepID=A0ABV7CRE4_9BACI
MELTITSEAADHLNRINQEGKSYLKLWYDTEGCGCAVNGLPTIRFTNENSNRSLEVKSDRYPVLIDSDQAVFFEEKMKLDVRNGSFRLTSPEGVLNPFISQQQVCEW